MACRWKPYQKSADGTGKFHNRSRQRQPPHSLGIPRLELLKRFPSEFWVGFYSVVLDESREHGQPRLLKKPEFQNGKTLRL